MASYDQRASVDGIPYIVAVEDTPLNYEHALPPIRPDDSPRRLYRSTVMALILAILGSSVLPVSYAFAKTGIVPGILISLVRYSQSERSAVVHTMHGL
jgi:hypothetical protein